MEASLRAFVALPLRVEDHPRFAELSRTLQANAAAAGDRGRWVTCQNVHLTMKFLATIPQAAAEALAAELPRLGAGQRRFELCAESLGDFGNPRRARLLALHLGHDARLDELASSIDRCAARLAKTALEERPFRPHLTLARFRRPVDLKRVSSGVTLDPAPFVFDSVVLYRSVTSPEGARYTRLAQAALG